MVRIWQPAAVHLPLTAPPLSHQLANPDSVEGLVLINIDTNARGWIDWAAQKVGFLVSVLSPSASGLAETWYFNGVSPNESSPSTNDLTVLLIMSLFIILK